ncbi:MAG: trigger factor [Acidobacteriota bacterium]|nr:trigger factor [Acidobacteriota bacterium]
MTEPIERLKSTVTDLGPGRKEIQAELCADEVAHELDHVLEHYAERARLKGFRAGKAPKDMVKQIYQHEIQHALVDELVPKVLEEILNGRDIHPVGTPVIEDLSLEDGSPLRFKAVVEVWPDFALPAYRKVRTSRRTAEVPETEVDKAIEDLRRKSAEYVPVDGRGVEAGDYVVIELQGRDLRTKRMRPTEKSVLLVGRAGNDPAVDENVRGLPTGESKVFRTSYPAESPVRALAGKDVEYSLKVQAIKAERLPELNDEFAKSLGEFESLEALRAKVRTELGKAREMKAKRDTSEDVLNQLVEQTAIELPPAAVEEEAEEVLKKTFQSIPPESITPQLVEEFRPRAREQAAAAIKRQLLLQRIAEAEKIDAGEEEIDQEIQDLARANGVPAARLLESFAQEGRREGLKATLILRKTVDFLVSQAIME